MQPQIAPRDFTPGAALPGDRGAHIAAQQAFASLNQTILQALAPLPGTEWLRMQVQAAEGPVDLWLLRAPVFAALVGVDTEQRQRRQALRRGLDSMFPDLDPPSGFTAL